MWNRLWLIAACATTILGVSSTSVPTVTLSIGDELTTTIQTFPHENFTCNLETPRNEIIQCRPQNKGDSEKYGLRKSTPFSGCSVNIMITGVEDDGTWRLFFELYNGSAFSQFYNVKVDGLPNIDQTTTTENPESYEPKREIEQLDSQFFNTHIGAEHIVTIRKYDFVNTESCHLMSNDGNVYDERDQIAGVSWITDINVACGVKINVDGEYLIGNWTLLLRAIRLSTWIEKRQPFTIYIEESIKAWPERIIVATGKNIHVRLAEPAPNGLQDTCNLVHENEDINLPYEKDENNKETCGFIIRNVRVEHQGDWHIVLGKTIIYKASIEVIVNGDHGSSQSYMTWEMDSQVDMLVGPENAVYCSIVDPAGRTIFQDFSRCRITIERVTQNQKGTWVLIVGAPGRISTDEHRIHVMIEKNREVVMPTVITKVEQQLPELFLSCSIPEDYQVRTCKFRDPDDKVLLAANGVSDEDYMNGFRIRISTNVSSTGCSLRIINPTTTAVGFWRCALETTDNRAFYGFLQVYNDSGFIPDYSRPTSVITAPTLIPKVDTIMVDEGDAVTLSCSIQTQIEYCYFSSDNGTVFNVHPGLSTDSMEYVGAGFQAGECGVRMTLLPSDSGLWSCHVGLLKADSNNLAPEQRAQFGVDVQPIFTVTQSEEFNNVVSLRGRVILGRAIDYCRYVRSDGEGFNEHNLPPNYRSWSYLYKGNCNLQIENASMLDRQPWTIVTRIRSHREEISGITKPDVILPPPPPPPPQPSPVKKTAPQVPGGQWRRGMSAAARRGSYKPVYMQ
ncbi:hypothetical protein evm_006034 [Chilo suppressalis]|nr:hypothetical protein evm_006034 [Chilo suppressalis]